MANKSECVADCPEMDYFMNESVSDVVFVIEGQRLPALKPLLSVKSRVFRAMFSENFKESKDKEVVICGTTFEAFKTFIQFLYCDQLVLEDENDFELMEEICKLCDRYEVNRLMAKIAKRISKTEFTSENIKWISRIAFTYQMKDMMSKVTMFIRVNFNKFANIDIKQLCGLNESTNNLLMELFATNYCKVSEQLDYFKGVSAFTKIILANVNCSNCCAKLSNTPLKISSKVICELCGTTLCVLK